MDYFQAISKNLFITNISDNTPIKDKLDALAIDLATNYCTVSFGEEEKKRVKLSEIFDTTSPLFKKLTDQINKKKDISDACVNDIVQHRNILIVGAGATYDSYKCIPLGSQVIEKFNEKYKNKIEAFPAIKEKFDNYLKELKLQNREPDFENILSLYSELILTPDELRSEISDLFNFRYSPSQFYEIIAHLFKHSFIDIIINFNFDEILDQAIEEELGHENYYRIISDGDCVPIEEMMVDGRLKIPIYIKPHGTVSHKSTLRFTKRHYLDVPEQIKELIIKLVGGERGEVIGKKKEEIEPIKKINVISVGFNMESLEFGDILNEYLPEQSKVYHVCYEEVDKRRDPFFLNRVFPKFYELSYKHHVVEELKPWDANELHRQIYTRIPVEQFNKNVPFNNLTTPFAEMFSYIWRTLFHLFRKDLHPRSIGRHEITSYFFYDPFFGKYSKIDSEGNREKVKERYERGTEYFLDRAILEIAMAINRNNGIIEISQVLGDRAGFYYKKYRDNYFKTKKTNKGAFTIYDLINQFGSLELQKSSDTTYSKNIFQLDTHSLVRLRNGDAVLEKLANDRPVDSKFINKSMRRWAIKDLKSNEYGNPIIDKVDDPVISILKKFNDLLRSKDPIYDPVPLVVIFRLFKVRYLSQTFISNFQKNYKTAIYNANYYRVQDYQSKEVTLLDEIARLFLKSNHRHFYSIRPKYHDPKNYLSESFSKSKILHTNLAVEYAFRHLFLNTSWDIALIVSETGSILNFLETRADSEKILKGRRIILLNSFDAIKQLNKDKGKDNIRLINQMQDMHYNELISKNKEISNNIVHTFSLPSIQHNHHTMLFIKKVGLDEKVNKNEVPIYEIKKANKTEAIFKMVGALYIYRQGFSNNLNPIMIGVEPYTNPDEDISTLKHDFKKLLRIFSTTFCRALAFEGVKKIKGMDVDLVKYQNWLPDEEVENINNFLRYLYNTDNANFEIVINPKK